MKKGFTLAEVLVTMGIVGLISVLTIPAIMKDYKNRVLVSSLEKTYSQLSDATKAIMAEEMAESLYKTRLATNNRKCGTELTQRKDDNEETAKARFDTYFKETAPLFDYYKNKNLLKTINAEGSIDEVWERLLKVIND